MRHATFPKHLTPELVTVDALAELVQIAGRVEKRDTSATREFFEKTNRLVGWLDVHSAVSGEGVQAFVQRLCLPERDGRPVPSAEECHQLLAFARQGREQAVLQSYALQLLEDALQQARLSDLIYWPRPGLDLADDEFLAIAKTKKGRALIPYLDPACGPNERLWLPVAADANTRRRIRRTLAAMVEAEELLIMLGEVLVSRIAQSLTSIRSSAAFADLLCESGAGAGELFADDEQLAMRLAQLRENN